MKAYSVAMLPGKEREYLSYGGKSKCKSYYIDDLTDALTFQPVIMPPSALANLSEV